MTFALALVLAAFPPKGARVHAAVEGKFSARAAYDVNRVNAPANGPREPPPLEAKPELVDALNAHVGEQLEGALQQLGLAIAKKDPARGFGLKLQVSPDDDTGGHASGLSLRAVVRDVAHPDVRGNGWSKVAIPVAGADPLVLLRGAIVEAVTLAFVSLQTRLEDDARTPRARLEVEVVPLAGTTLDDAQRQAAEALAKCAAQLAEPLSVKPAGDRALEVEVRLDVPEADFLKSWAGRIQLETGVNGKMRCARFHTPLEGLELNVVERPARHALVVTLATPVDAGEP